MGGIMKTLDRAALVAVLAVSAGVLAGCGRPDALRVCADATGRRLPDGYCSNRGGAHGSWVYFGRGGAPAIGQKASGGSLSPAEGVHYGLAPEGGVSRGGFGSTGRSFGFHGGGE